MSQFGNFTTGGGRGGRGGTTSDGAGFGSGGGGRGAFSGAQSGFSQNNTGDAQENSEFGSSRGGRGAFGGSRGGFGQNNTGDGTGFGGGGRGGFGGGRGGFSQNNTSDTQENSGFGSSRGGRGAFGGGRGGFGENNTGDGAGSGGGGRGAFGGGRGGFGQNNDTQENSEFGSSRGGRGAFGGGRGGFGENNTGDGAGGGRGAFGGGRGGFGQNNDTQENSGFGSSRGGRGAFGGGLGGFGEDNTGDGAGFGSGGGGRGAFGGGRGGFGQNNTADTQENSGFGSGRGGRGGFGGGRGGFNQNNTSDAQENSGFGSNRGGRGAFGGGRGGFSENNSGDGAGFGGGRGAFGGGRGGFSQNNTSDAQENSGFGSSRGGRGAFGGGRGGFGENNTGDGTGFGGGGRGGFGGGRGAFGGGRGGFSQDNTSDAQENSGFDSNRGGRGAFGGGRGGFNQNNTGDGTGFGAGGRGAFGGGRGGFGHNNGDAQENSGFGPKQGGFGSDSGRRGNATEGNFGGDNAEQGNHGNRDGEEQERTPMNYVPQARNVDDLFSEDQRAANDYADVVEHDDDVVIENFDGPVVRMQKWEEVELEPQLLTNIKERSKYGRPRKIQGATIPFILDKFDIKAQAETGSGKTAAFVVPIIDCCMRAKSGKGEELFESEMATPYAIIIGPTRELVMQVFEQAEKFAAGTGVSVAKAYGQYNIGRNHHEIRAGCDILVATPGRLKHFIKGGEIRVNKLKFLVLDEADRLLDDSFSLDIMEIVNVTGFPDKNNRQTLLFSATFPNQVMHAADQLLRPKAVFITNHRNNPNKRIKQDFVVSGGQGKLDKLTEILTAEAEKVGGSDKMRRTLVFVNTKRMSDMAALYLSQHDIPATSINGDRGQHLREQALAEFRSHKVAVLCATDVCARGIDVKELDHVINMEVPSDAITYVHRIGRCGRIAQGYSTTFIEGHEPVLNEIAAMMRESSEEIPEVLKSALDQNGGGAAAPAFGQSFAAPSNFANNVPSSGEAAAPSATEDW